MILLLSCDLREAERKIQIQASTGNPLMAGWGKEEKGMKDRKRRDTYITHANSRKKTNTLCNALNGETGNMRL